MATILISAGDLSGERYAADLVRSLSQKRPGSRFLGLGGAAMAEQGVELVVDQRDLAVGGVFEAAGSAGRLMRAWHQMRRAIRTEEPDLAILVDSGGFNLPLAKRLRRNSTCPIFYYIAPQAWAWREGRVRTLAERTDRIAVILPFEKDFYAKHGVDVDYVGHPLLDRITADGVAPGAHDRAAARDRLGLRAEGPLVALYPGSRRSELKYHLALFIDVVARLRKERPDLEAAIALAPTLDAAAVEAELSQRPEQERRGIAVVDGASIDLARAADVAITKPGTTTLELMLNRCPMVVAGRVHPWTARFVRRSLAVEHVSMPNLLLGRKVVPECLQEGATAESIAAAASVLFEGPERETQRRVFSQARSLLGSPGAAARAASIAEELLGTA